MDLTPYVDTLLRDLGVAAEAGGAEARALADRLAAQLQSAMRLALLDALSAAIAEITRELAPGSVDLRLRGRELEFVVTLPPDEEASAPAGGAALSRSARSGSEGDDASVVRINLRLPEDLKGKVEESARQAGVSVNSWLVRAAAAAVHADSGGRTVGARNPVGAERWTGWVR